MLYIFRQGTVICIAIPVWFRIHADLVYFAIILNYEKNISNNTFF